PTELTEWLAPYLPANYQADMDVVSRPLDWLGINYYTRSLYKASQTPGRPLEQGKGPLEKTDIGWEIYPKGLSELLVRVSNEYTKLPIYVTENGMAEAEGGNDPRRVKYYEDHLKAVLAAQKEGADVRGYFAWSLLDNYEWAEGYSKRFGLVHVDYETQQRTPKSSYRSFQGLLHNTRYVYRGCQATSGSRASIEALVSACCGAAKSSSGPTCSTILPASITSTRSAIAAT